MTGRATDLDGQIPTPEELARRLAEALPRQLVSCALYGSAAAGDFVPGASNYNLLLLIDPLSTHELDGVARVFAPWAEAGHPTPLVFTPAGLAHSIDTFPIELLDIQQSRRILYGTDPLARLDVQPKDLRLQVERELTGKLLSLRGRYLGVAGDRAAQAQLMLWSLSTILVLFRAALRLYQAEVPAKKLAALRALRGHVPFDLTPFERLLAWKEAGTTGPGPVAFEDYLRGIETVISAVNQRTHSSRNDA